ncbi:transcriptional regulator [Paenibacillus sp. LPE1-1-1.1]|uniref:transcriptional regulator n=1 Tax=Paenibacillus sp. LPE1-1-1.1 TaxID=3135230 RepID=UPI0034456B15
MSSTIDDNKLLKLLAVSLVDSPRGTFNELAKSVGISKATLHRFCGTRENLETLLIDKSKESMENVICVAEKEYDDYVNGVKLLIKSHYEGKEFLRYSCSFQNCTDDEYWNTYAKAIDSFFLRAQRQGVFRSDFSVSVLSELFLSVIFGVIDSERRGRVASSYMLETIEQFFLYGALNPLHA